MSNRFWLRLGMAVTAILVIAVVLIGGFNSDRTEMEAIRVQRVFADLDDDGDVDLIVSGEVVLNNGPFRQALPCPSTGPCRINPTPSGPSASQP